MGKLMVYLKGYKKETVLAPLFKMLEASFELLVPLVMVQIIDRGIAGADGGFIFRMSLIMITLGIIGLVCSITAQYFAAKAAVGFSAQLKHSLFAHIQSLSFSEMDEIGASTLITRMTSDVNQVQSGVNLILRLFLRSPFIVAGAMVMAFTIDVKSAMVFTVTIPLLCVVVFGIMLISMPLYKALPSRGKEEYLYDDKALERYRKKHTGAFTLQRYKGLGEMDSDQLWETTMDPENRRLKQVEIEDARLASSVTEMLMGTEVPPRRRFIYENAVDAELDV